MIILLTLFFSFILLLWSANHLVTGAAGIASFYRISPLTIGLITALGTTSPEILVSIVASLDGSNDIALGNAIGSNIANIGLILGITTLIRPQVIHSANMRHEYPLLFLVMLFSYFLMIDGYLSVMDGTLLLLGCIALIGYFVLKAQSSPNDAYTKAFIKRSIKRPMRANWFSLVLGLLILPVSAHFLVHGSVQLASWMGVGELVISLTIIAIGTSLPELMTSLVAAYKGQEDIAIGNILGSNMFNLLLVLAFPGLINPSSISHVILWRDIPIMFVVTGVLAFMNYYYNKNIIRWQGGLLLLIYCCYITSIVISAVYK